jgi:hypothetical protein
MQSALLNDLSPLNVLQHAPDPTFADSSYSPLWDLHLMRWSPASISTDQRQKIFSWSEGTSFARRGMLVNAFAPPNSAGQPGLRPAGIAINCPLVVTFSREAP